MAGLYCMGGWYFRREFWISKGVVDMRTASISAVPLALLLAAGCSTPYYDTNTDSSYPTYSARPLTSSEVDRTLEASVRSQLTHYGDLSASCSNVRVTARSGTVALNGTVPSERDREMVESVPRNTSGVVAVNDQLQIVYPPTGTYTEPGIYTVPSRVYSSAPAPVVTPEPVLVAPHQAPVYAAGPNLTVQAAADSDRV